MYALSMADSVADLSTGFPFFTVFNAVGKLVITLQQVHAIKKHNPVIAQEIEYFIKSLHENIDLLKKQRTNEKSWALESLETDLNAVTSYLEDNLRKGSFLQFWDARQIKDKLERLRQDLINKFQVKLFVTTLEVTIDAGKKMDDFGSRMIELSSLNTAKTHAETIEIRKLLQPLVVGMKRQDHRIQSLVSIVRQNEVQVETSTDTQKFVEDVLASLQDLTVDEESSSRPSPAEDDHDDCLDPITAELMIDPVKCTDGETYDRLTVLKNNLTQQKQLVIACDDVSLRRRLFKKFRDEDIERRFYGQRKSYRDEALELANTGHSAEALTMLKNVLQWAPNDKECREKRDELQLDLDAKLEKAIRKANLMELSKLYQALPEDSTAERSTKVFHKGVACDGCSDPTKSIVGPRFGSLVSNYDLCLSCFQQGGHREWEFLRMDLPFGPRAQTFDRVRVIEMSILESQQKRVVDMSKLEENKVVRRNQKAKLLEMSKLFQALPEDSAAESWTNVSHNAICDGCDPTKLIVGPRFGCLVKVDYDLCLSCFEKGGHREWEFLRMDLPFGPRAQAYDRMRFIERSLTLKQNLNHS